MNSYFEMPFRERARITITNEHPKDITSFFYTVNYAETDSRLENTRISTHTGNGKSTKQNWQKIT